MRGKPSQKDALRQQLRDRYPVGARFSLSEVYRHAVPLLETFSPESQGHKPAIRAYLQHFRDEGMLEFCKRGEYRRLT